MRLDIIEKSQCIPYLTLSKYESTTPPENYVSYYKFSRGYRKIPWAQHTGADSAYHRWDGQEEKEKVKCKEGKINANCQASF